MKIKLLLALTLFILSGCSTITVTEFDPTTGVKTKETVTKNTTVATIISSTKDKSILTWSSGWVVWLEFSPGTTEDPTPHGKIKAGCLDIGTLLICKDQQNIKKIAPVILATRSNLSVNSTGATSTTPK